MWLLISQVSLFKSSFQILKLQSSEVKQLTISQVSNNNKKFFMVLKRREKLPFTGWELALLFNICRVLRGIFEKFWFFLWCKFDFRLTFWASLRNNTLKTRQQSGNALNYMINYFWVCLFFVVKKPSSGYKKLPNSSWLF